MVAEAWVEFYELEPSGIEDPPVREVEYGCRNGILKLSFHPRGRHLRYKERCQNELNEWDDANLRYKEFNFAEITQAKQDL
ncbi:hypothetical protein TNCV_2127591 [Trichonephila clavipes]|nr:hypothetical protein TNCV_2127591 [Trichonephila clavipes]